MCVPPVVLCQTVEGKGEWPCFSEFSSRFSCAGLLYPMWWDNSEYSDVTPMLTVNISDLCVVMELDIPSLYNNVLFLEVLLYVALVWGAECLTNAFEAKWIFTFSQMLCCNCDEKNIYACWSSVVVKRCGIIRNFVSLFRYSYLSTGNIIHTYIIMLSNTYYKRTLTCSPFMFYFSNARWA